MGPGFVAIVREVAVIGCVVSLIGYVVQIEIRSVLFDSVLLDSANALLLIGVNVP